MELSQKAGVSRYGMATNTPFFQVFDPLLFRRRPRHLIEEVKELRSLGELYQLFGEILPNHLLARSESGPNYRERILTPKVMFWAFVSQVFDVDSACRDVVRKVEAWWRWMQKDRTRGQAPMTPMSLPDSFSPGVRAPARLTHDSRSVPCPIGWLLRHRRR